MSLRRLLDTNICIYIKRDRPPHVRQKLARMKPGSVALSYITWAELLYGAARSQDPVAARNKLDAVTQRIPVLPLHEATAEHYGDIRARLFTAGTPIGNKPHWYCSMLCSAPTTRQH